jgi:RsiW-degrading membrane proteinase PrsW (M82 family)
MMLPPCSWWTLLYRLGCVENYRCDFIVVNNFVTAAIVRLLAAYVHVLWHSVFREIKGIVVVQLLSS